MAAAFALAKGTLADFLLRFGPVQGTGTHATRKHRAWRNPKSWIPTTALRGKHSLVLVVEERSCLGARNPLMFNQKLLHVVPGSHALPNEQNLSKIGFRWFQNVTNFGVMVEYGLEINVYLCWGPAKPLESGACDHCEPAAPRGNQSFTTEMKKNCSNDECSKLFR